MMDMQAILQSALDKALNGAVCVFWQRKTEVADNPSPDEYVVYTRGIDTELEQADNGQVLIKEAVATIRYYYRCELAETEVGRARVKGRERKMLAALKEAGFSCSGGFFDAGDVDEIDCFTSVAECSFWRAI